MLTWRHPRLPPRPFDTKIFVKRAGQSRLILITDNEGCVRYPTEGNNSNHELTTAMQHLSSRPCETTDVSTGLRLDF